MVPKPTPRTPLHPLSPSATQNLPTLPPLASRHTAQKPKQTSGPSRIQDYEVGRLLGRGGFGYVYYARCQKGGEYAIKMIDKKVMKSSNMTARVANEVEIHWQLRHSSILKLYNYFEDQSYVYLVMELCENGELYKFIQHRKQPLSEPQVRFIMEQVVQGLLYLHSHGIIHRDLKLSNLLLTKDWDVKIADFGLAVKLAEHGEQKTMCGTPNYISPEIISKQPYGLTADVWSFGCMIFTCLTGKPPFESKQIPDTLERVKNVEYRFPSCVSPLARDLISKLLKKDPNERLPLDAVLNHPFFSKSQPSENLAVPLLVPAISNIPTISLPRIRSPNSQTFSTLRLKPLTQKTSQGSASILPSGSVLLDLMADRYVMLITGDGQTIKFFRKPWRDESDPFIQEYPKSSLPEKYLRKWQYAARFVEIVRGKSPKIIFYSPQAKCILMEDISHFQMQLYNGPSLQLNSAKNLLTISYTNETPKEINTLQAEQELSGNDWAYWKHMKECHRQCIEVEQDGERTGKKWPLILKSSGVHDLDEIKNNPYHRPITIGSRSQTPFAPSTRGGVPSIRIPASNAEGSQMDVSIHSRQPIANLRGGTTASAPVKKLQRMITPNLDARSAPTVVSRSVSGSPSARYGFINNVGWCVQGLDNCFQCLLVDGTRLCVEGRGAWVEWSQGDDVRRFPVDPHLPEYVKTKLALIPQFVSLLSESTS